MTLKEQQCAVSKMPQVSLVRLFLETPWWFLCSRALHKHRNLIYNDSITFDNICYSWWELICFQRGHTDAFSQRGCLTLSLIDPHITPNLFVVVCFSCGTWSLLEIVSQHFIHNSSSQRPHVWKQLQDDFNFLCSKTAITQGFRDSKALFCYRSTFFKNSQKLLGSIDK